MGKKQLMLIMGGLGVVLVALLAFLYFQISEAGDMWPAHNEPGTLTADVNRLNRDIAGLRDEVKKIPPAKERLESLQVEYDLSTRVLPRESSPDQLLAAIRTKAHQAGVVPARLVPRVSSPRTSGRRSSAMTPTFEEWWFDLEISGTYDQIGTFVNLMEEFDSSDGSRMGSEKRFFEVRTIDIASELSGLRGLGGSRIAELKGHHCKLTMLTYRYSSRE